MLEVIFLIAFILTLGFIALEIFQKTKLSQVIVLVIFGLLIGPIFHLVNTDYGSLIRSLAPFMSTLALIFLLFDAGLGLNLSNIVEEVGKATLFTTLVYLVSAGVAAGLFSLFFNVPVLVALLAGFIVGGVSSAIVIALLEGADVDEDTKTVLSIESTLTDIFVVVFSLMTINILLYGSSASPQATDPIILIVRYISVSLIMGLIGFASWIWLFSRVETHKFSYMLTVAIMLFLYVLTQRTGGSGGFAIFVFGILLGNFGSVERYFSYLGGLRGEIYKLLIAEIKNFDMEITFFIRTFLFVLTGLLLSLNNISWAVLILSIVVSILFILVRYGIFKLLYPSTSEFVSWFAAVMIPRGLAAIVVVTILPDIVGGNMLIKPYMDLLEAFTVLVILFSNLFTSGGIYWLYSGNKRRALLTTSESKSVAQPATRPGTQSNTQSNTQDLSLMKEQSQNAGPTNTNIKQVVKQLKQKEAVSKNLKRMEKIEAQEKSGGQKGPSSIKKGKQKGNKKS